MTGTLGLASTSTFMTDYQGGAVITHDGPLAVSADADHNTMIFGVDSQQHVHLVQAAPGTATGWTDVDLWDGRAASATPRLLAAARTAAGAVSLVVVASDGGADRILETGTFSASSQHDRWTDRGTIPDGRIDDISVGFTGDGRPMIVAMVRKDTHIDAWLINPDPNDTTWNAKVVPSPIDGASDLATVVGHNARLESLPNVVALLYSLKQTTEGTTALTVTAAPSFETFNHQIPVSGTMSAIATADDGRDSLLAVAQVGDDGRGSLRVLDATSQLSKQPATLQPVPVGQVTLPGAIDRLALTTASDGRADVWAHVTGKGTDTLYHAARAVDGAWSSMTAFAANVAATGMWQDPTTGAVSVVAVDLDDHVTWYQQDPQSTRWTPHAVRLTRIGPVTEVHGYQTRIQVTDANDVPQMGATVSIGVAERSLLHINGQTHDVWPGAPLTATTDGTGAVTVTQPVNGLTAPPLTVAAGAAPTSLDPMSEIKSRVVRLSAEDLRKAQKATTSYATTEPLLPNATSAQVDTAHTAISQLVARGASLPSIHTSGAAPCLPSSAAPSTPSIATFSAGDGASSSGDGDPVVAFFGDLWHAVKHGLEEVAEFVVHELDEGLLLVVHLAEQVWHVVVQFAEQVWDVIETVFAKIGAAIADLVKWLGFIFAWHDILNTHTVLRVATEHALDDLVNAIGDGKSIVSNAFDELRSKLDIGSLRKRAETLPNTPVTQTTRSLHSAPGSDRSEYWWASNHVTSSDTLGGDNGSPTGEIGDVVTAIEEPLDDIKDTIEQVGKTLAADVGTLSVAETAKQVLGVIEDGLLDAAEDASLGILTIVQDTASEFRGLVEARWNIPVLTALYEDVIAPGSTFDLLDIACLVAAIPGTIAYKLTTEEPPFSDDLVSKVKATTDTASFIAALAPGIAPQSAFGLAALRTPTPSTPPSPSSPSGLRPAAALHASVAFATPSSDNDGSSSPAKAEPKVPEAARNATYAFGYIGSIGAVVYGILNGAGAAAEEAGTLEMVANPIKFVAGLVVNVSGTINAGIALGYEASARVGYEVFATAWQWWFSLKDGVAAFATSGRTSSGDERTLGYEMTQQILNAIESALGVLNVPIFLALFIWEEVDAVSDGDGAAAGLAIAKLVQNEGTAVTQILSLPASLDPEPDTKTAMVAAMIGLGVLAGLINAGRTIGDHVDKEVHNNF